MGFRKMIFSFASLAPAYDMIKATLERFNTECVTGIDHNLTPKKVFDNFGI